MTDTLAGLSGTDWIRLVDRHGGTTPSVVHGGMRIGHVDRIATFRANTDATTLLFVPDDTRLALDDGAPRSCGAGDIVVLSPGARLRIAVAPDAAWLTLAADERLFATVLARRTGLVLAASFATAALRRYVDALALLAPAALDPVQQRFAASSIRELLGAAAATVAAAPPRGARRAGDALSRITAYVDARLADPVTVVHACRALGCSRSALYRATEPAGGLVELVMQRRLAAVHRALLQPGERRCIAEIARAHGFADPCQFSRRFRRAFGVSAGQVRSAATAGPADGVLFDPDHAALFAVDQASPAASVPCRR